MGNQGRERKWLEAFYCKTSETSFSSARAEGGAEKEEGGGGGGGRSSELEGGRTFSSLSFFFLAVSAFCQVRGYNCYDY